MPSANIMDGNTDAMRSLALTPMDTSALQSTAPACGALDGCKAFIQKDTDATKKLQDFVTAANAGLEQYNTVSKASGMAYQDSAIAGRAALEGVEWRGARSVDPGGK